MISKQAVRSWNAQVRPGRDGTPPLHEIYVLQRLQAQGSDASDEANVDFHTYILPAIFFFETENFAFIAFPFLDHTDLLEFCAERFNDGGVYHGTCPEELTVAKWFIQIASALAYMHSRMFAHRDVKPDNILIKSYTGNMRNMALTLGDFGVAREVTLSPTCCRTVVGTAAFMAPEAVRLAYGLGGTNVPVDVYGAGASMFYLATMMTPQPDNYEFYY